MANEVNSLVLFAAPSIEDEYYANFFDDLLDFYARFVRDRHPSDTPFILVDRKTAAIARQKIPEAYLAIAEVADPWLRDVAPLVARDRFFDFSYRPSYLPENDARSIETACHEFFRNFDVPTTPVPLVLDGGNFVGNGRGKAVLTDRVFLDNPERSPREIEAMLKENLGLDAIAFIPEEGDALGHADGMVAWLTPEKLAVCAFEDTAFLDEVLEAIAYAFSNVESNIEIVTVPCQPTERTYDKFADATGIYTNILVTANAIYLPVYDLPEDAEVRNLFAENSDRTIVPIPMGKVALLGGSVRCLSWQVEGAIAREVAGKLARKNLP